MEVARIGDQPYQEENLQVGMLTLHQHTVTDRLGQESPIVWLSSTHSMLCQYTIHPVKGK